MRGFELNSYGQAERQDIPVVSQPLTNPEMLVQSSEILRFMIEERMKMAMLFDKNRTMPKHDPFSCPELPEEMRPHFDTGGGMQ